MPSVPEDTDLSRLLAAEAEFERLLANARSEAEGILAEAAGQAAARERGLEGQLRAEATALKEHLDRERAKREAELDAVATADAGRYQGISDQRIAAVAELILTRLVGAT